MNCEKCKNKCKEKGQINLTCLTCKWQYVGQECFDKKPNLFVENTEEDSKETTKE